MIVSRLTILLILALTLVACRATGDSTPQPGSVLFQDDFSDPASGWNQVSEANGLSDYDDGAYRIRVDVLNTDIWARPQLDFNDVRIEVDAFKAGGDRNNRFGVICRAAADHFYIFLVSSDGYYGIGKVQGNQYELVGMEAMQPSEKINQGTAGNHLAVECVGSRLSLSVNGEKLAEVEDVDFASGDVGLIAGTYNLPGTEIIFDNFSVTEPPPNPGEE